MVHYAKDEPAPVQLRGVLDEEPIHHRAPPDDPLSSRPRGGDTATVLRVREIRRSDNWLSASGRVRVVGVEDWPELHCGDAVEVVGQLVRVAPPGNPGEFDYAGYLRDRNIRTVLTARKTSQAVTRLERGWPRSFTGWLAVIRGRGQRILRETLPPRLEGLASALLLGEDSLMSRTEWDKYIRTGVIHVLAISGQHLVILAGFLWFMLPRLGVRQWQGAWIVALVVLSYALLTGGRPPALRSAVAVCAVCGGLILRRRVLPANLFALSWIAVALVNPTDLFSAGCLLSFLAVAVLTWGTPRMVAARGRSPGSTPRSDPAGMAARIATTGAARVRELRDHGADLAGDHAAGGRTVSDDLARRFAAGTAARRADDGSPFRWLSAAVGRPTVLARDGTTGFAGSGQPRRLCVSRRCRRSRFV